MKIYQQEINDGIGEAITSCTSVAYDSVALVSDSSSHEIEHLLKKIKADANPNQIDLFYIKSVLVSTGWNKNDDVFDTAETWAARNTPEDKQFNFMHNENDIIGHITSSYVVDKDGNKVEAEEAPKDFDIIAEAVLYNSWTNPDNRDRMRKIIAEIQEGKWYVSMECLFAGFDYAISGKDGMSKTLARNEETSFLTKHLRAYGGNGEYQGYKIGRSLKQISFSGKGLVAKPANPRSVILDASKADQQIVLQDLKQGDYNMSNENVLEQQIADLKVELATAKEALEASQAKESEEAIATLEATVAEKEAECASLKEELKAVADKVTELEEVLATKDKDMDEKMEELRKMKKAEKARKRMASLIEAGFDEEEAEASLEAYDALEDEAFDSIVAVMKKKYTVMKKEEEEKAMKMKKEEAKPVKAEETDEVSDVEAEEAAAEEATEELFDGVDSTEATLVDSSDENEELEATRASVAEWLENNVLSK